MKPKKHPWRGNNTWFASSHGDSEAVKKVDDLLHRGGGLYNASRYKLIAVNRQLSRFRHKESN